MRKGILISLFVGWAILYGWLCLQAVILLDRDIYPLK